MTRKINARMAGVFTQAATRDRQVLAYSAEDDNYKPTDFALVSDTVIPPTATANAAPTLLAVQQRGATPGLFRVSGGVSFSGPLNSQTFDAAEASTVLSGYAPCNDAVEFMGKHYAVHTVSTTSYGVWERQSNGTWSRVFTLTQTAGPGSRSGLHVINDDQGVILAFVVIGTGGNPALSLCKTSDGTSWTTTNLGTVNTANGGSCKISSASIINSRGSLYIAFRSAGAAGANSAAAVSVRAATMAAIVQPSATQNVIGCFAAIYGRVFYLYGHNLYEYSGGTFTSRASLTNGGSASLAVHLVGQCLLFQDGDAKLVAIYQTSSAGAVSNSFWRAADIVFASTVDTAPTVTQRDSLVPAVLASGGAASNKSNGGFWCHIDNENDPGNPQVFIWWGTDETSSVSYDKYTGSTVTLGGTSTGVSVSNFALSFGRAGGGERISADDVSDVRFDYVTTAVGTAGIGTWKVTARYQAVDTSKTYAAKVFVSTTEGTQLAEATLTGTATGGTRDGNAVTGTAHNTPFSVHVDLVAMGIAHNSLVRIAVKLYEE